MKTIKTSLCLSIILAVTFYWIIFPIFAQETTDLQEIKNTIENYYNGVSRKDIDSMMKQVSKNYYKKTREGKIVGYDEFKSQREEKILNATLKYDFTISDINLLKSDIQDDKAAITIEFTQNRVYFGTHQKENKKFKRLILLAKDDGVWKIIRMHHRF
jgi:hypothetical protein